MLKGFDIVKPMIKGLEDYMVRKGYRSLENMIGAGLHMYKDFSELDFNKRVIASIDSDKCKKCHKCYVAARDAAHQCIRIDRKQRFCSVIPEHCSGCGLCTIVCAHKAISMVTQN